MEDEATTNAPTFRSAGLEARRTAPRLWRQRLLGRDLFGVQDGASEVKPVRTHLSRRVLATGLGVEGEDHIARGALHPANEPSDLWLTLWDAPARLGEEAPVVARG